MCLLAIAGCSTDRSSVGILAQCVCAVCMYACVRCGVRVFCGGMTAAAETAVALLDLVVPVKASRPHLASFVEFLNTAPARRISFDEVRARVCV